MLREHCVWLADQCQARPGSPRKTQKLTLSCLTASQIPHTPTEKKHLDYLNEFCFLTADRVKTAKTTLTFFR